MTVYHVNTTPRGFMVNTINKERVPTTLPVDRNAKASAMPPVIGEPDVEFGAIWEKYRSINGQVIPLSLILTASTKFCLAVPDFMSWCWHNAVNNVYLSDYGVEFILDCIGYSQSGERKYPLSAWAMLLETYPEPRKISSRRSEMFSNVAIPDTVTLISNWCSQKHGFEDFMEACHILFTNQS